MTLNLAGWIVMTISVTSVLALTIYCTYTVLMLPAAPEDPVKGPLEIDTRDTQDAD